MKVYDNTCKINRWELILGNTIAYGEPLWIRTTDPVLIKTEKSLLILHVGSS
jgi:hypothetical protein